MYTKDMPEICQRYAKYMPKYAKDISGENSRQLPIYDFLKMLQTHRHTQ